MGAGGLPPRLMPHPAGKSTIIRVAQHAFHFMRGWAARAATTKLLSFHILKSNIAISKIMLTNMHVMVSLEHSST
jgi:hypothetical protein